MTTRQTTKRHKLSIKSTTRPTLKPNKVSKTDNHNFNINSTQQLGEVLFDQLGLPVIKKTNT